MPTGKHLNKDSLNELKTIMGEEFSNLLETFRVDSAQRIQSIYAAVESGDGEAIRRAAHSFKGSAGNMGAVTLNELCRQLEELGGMGGGDGAADLARAIEEEYQLVSTELKTL